MQLTAAMVSYYSKTLRQLPLATRAEKTRSFLATSPVKIFSSFWAGGSNQNQNGGELSTSGSRSGRPLSIHRNNSQHSFLSSLGSLRGKDGEKIATEEIRPENPLVRLERTFVGYVAALQSRKGLIIGRTLLNRAMTDELVVNDFYNKLIEMPYEIEATSELVSTEVIFVAFEKFLRIAWTEQMGPVMSMQSMNTLQERANKKVPGEFADFVNFLFGDMAPQNRRAFTSMIKLLADLLDGCGNDSDRGALTLAFSELLVYDGSAPNYINLLDRLVEDCDRIFEEPGLNHSFNLGSQAYESINSAIRGNKSYTGSVTSNTSSLRRKFGFDTLLRQNSKDERSSVWRTLSKHRNPATGETSTLTRTPIGRAETMDDGALSKRMLRRPGSRDRPPIAGAFDDSSRPPSSYRLDFSLSTIGEPDNEMGTVRPKKKRRSSLSDLKSLMAAATLTDDQEEAAEPEPQPQPLQDTKQTSEKFNSSPRSPKAPSPSRIPISSPSASQSLRSPRQKENVTDYFQGAAPSAGSPVKRESPSKHRHSKTLSTSHIPTLRPARSGNSGADSPTRLGSSSSPTRSPQRLRLQSPQKLRERLATEKKALEEVDTALKSELSKIGEEMARVNNASLSGSQGGGGADLGRLLNRFKALEARIPEVMLELGDKQSLLQRDMDNTVRASEAKVKAIDQLYKETKAENELLYEKFNEDLGKIVQAIKGKGKEGKEELMVKLKKQSEEAARMKMENEKLKRENVSLRAALKGTAE